MDSKTVLEQKYKEIIRSYLDNQDEQVLYQAQKLSRKSIEHRISPEEIINWHRTVMLEVEPNQSSSLLKSFDVLLELMMGYGLAYREHQSLRFQQQELKTEIEVAASMQKTLLGTKVPKTDFLDIGAISVPAKHMSGDYFHFVKDENGCIGVAIADVIGKGIPAALCMSMIKYAMDSLQGNGEPHIILESLNRVVEQNVDPNMFITMFYGLYNPVNHRLYYSSAGHEPGFYYDSNKREFTDLYAKGLLLGIEKKTNYHQYEKFIQKDDLIILLSDGVTECRTNEGFIERNTLTRLIAKNLHLSAQEIVINVYKELERLQAFQLRDDFTLIILKRIN
ncbi:PP2C family protein-serine/threonine phosphatase [Heyndrickxia vini]|uniref:PP2C family protein-serine/threonine phosphatase n=1 Tax=Heyndrickxia vini TaxID=1476025 RepID=A0ABX7E474_9BACI|nr:PP2C family protein-serine/threonine phosphatase [Heyndrickxia vini]QQZ09157.1 PP2C family protein-serine/threonine phosphatase [Heyndrickxia vini]